MTGRRSFKQERLARIYDAEILPIWSHRFGRMMLRDLELPPKAVVLDVAAGTGYPAVEVMRRLDEGSRLIAIDSNPTMLDVARRKAGDLSGKRVFFRTESAAPRLSFANDVYDVVLCNLGLLELPNPRRALRDFARVAKPGGLVICTLPLRGTWGEFFDLYREVLVKHDYVDALARLERHVAAYPEPEEVEWWMSAAGLADPRLEMEEFTLLFRSAREFFFAPIVEYGPLPKWKEIAGHGHVLQDIFWHIKEAIDAYFGGRAFQVTVKAGCLQGRRGAVAAEATGPAERIDDDDEGIPIQTDQVELVESLAELDQEEELEAFRDVAPRKP